MQPTPAALRPLPPLPPLVTVIVLVVLVLVHHRSGQISTSASQLPQAAGAYDVDYVWVSGSGEEEKECPGFGSLAHQLVGRLYRDDVGAAHLAVNATLSTDYGHADDLVIVTARAWMNGGWKRVGGRRFADACQTAARYAATSPAAAAALALLATTTGPPDNRPPLLKCPIKTGSYYITIPVAELTNLMREMHPIFFYGKFKMNYVSFRGGNKTACFSYIKEIVRKY